MVDRIASSAPTMTLQEFIRRWRGKTPGEKQAAQTWFLDLLKVVGHPDPIEVGNFDKFTFEKAVPGGFADAYLEGCFGWEFKRAEAQLPGAFDQLLRYQVYLKTPPLLVVSSFQLIRVQTNFRDKETVVHDIPIAELGDPEQLSKLHNIFFDPGAFEPQRTVEQVTRETALLFGRIVEDMEQRGSGGERLARYLNQIVFCLYAEDAGLLRGNLFSDIVLNHFRNPDVFNSAVKNLFDQMARGGLFGADSIAHFNGDLFNESDTVELSEVSLYLLREAMNKNWRDIEPSIFGTLFEGVMDATKRSRLGAHYTSAEDIMLVVEPVIVKPLEREWNSVRQEANTLISQDNKDAALARLEAFQQRIAGVKVLDPACGSGNFLYVAMRSLLDLEKKLIYYAGEQGWHHLTPSVNPGQMLGIETDHYAIELARTALWIGYIQWHQTNGFPYTQQPILTSLTGVRQMDAILDYDADGNPIEPQWHNAEFIVGNPPFLGNKLLRGSLGDEYVTQLFDLYGDRLPGGSDLVCYWFEKARAMVADGRVRRAGLLATQGIRGEANRTVLQRIKESGDIFLAHSDRPWILDGAMVHVSIVGFDDSSEKIRELDGQSVSHINANLMSGIDLTDAERLPENMDMAFNGIIKSGAFEVQGSLAEVMLANPNAHGKSNRDVLKPWINGKDVTTRSRGMWIIDFQDMSLEEAALYEMPFEYINAKVRPSREKNRDRQMRTYWWRLGRNRAALYKAIKPLKRFIVTPRVAKHRIFVWVGPETAPDTAVVAIAHDDDYIFGVLHSHIHEAWARAMGTQLREAESGFRYSHTATFETFPFPRPTDEQREAIADAARELNRLREGWLNPVDAEGKSMMFGVDLRRYTLTNLYNEYERHTWLVNAHNNLNAAVAAAYAWPANSTDEQILERLLALNLERADAES